MKHIVQTARQVDRTSMASTEDVTRAETCASSLEQLAGSLNALRDVLLQHQNRYAKMVIATIPGANSTTSPS